MSLAPSSKLSNLRSKIFSRLTLLTLFTANGENFSIFTTIDKIFWPFYAETAKQSVFLRIQVRASTQTKGLERGWKQRARLGERRSTTILNPRVWTNSLQYMENEQSVFFLSPHTLLRHTLPISLLILRKKTTVLQSIYAHRLTPLRP